MRGLGTGVSGAADLPLHWGHVPPWLLKVMRRMSRAILEVVIIELGPEALLKRLSNPLWFQAFNNAIGMDWDSSGSTTVTTALIKEALQNINADVRVAGGKGKHSLKTPEEIVRISEELSMGSKVAEELVTTSKLGAKADNVLLQDGYSLYHHAIVFDRLGRWVIIQQGMNPEERMARRYHLSSFVAKDPITDPHSGVASDHVTKPLNVTVSLSEGTRKTMLDLSMERPENIAEEIRRVSTYLKGQRTLFDDIKPPRPILRIPYYRPVRLTPQLLRTLNKVYEARPRDFREFVSLRGVGPEVIRALSLVAELIYREPPPLNDPVSIPYSPFKYAYTIGGKDGIPYPVKREVAVAVVRELENIVENAKLGSKERVRALKALARLAPKDYGSF